MQTDIWEKLGEIGREAPEETWEEFTAQVEATHCRPNGELSEAKALLSEALDAMLNLAPAIRRERSGCFGNRQFDCMCTACKIRRFMGPNCNVTGAEPVGGASGGRSC